MLVLLPITDFRHTPQIGYSLAGNQRHVHCHHPDPLDRPQPMNAYPVVDMTTDALLTTTRSVRKRLDLSRDVPLELVRECLDIALQAPTSANRQHWSFVVIADPGQKRRIAEIYKRQWDWLASTPYAVDGRFADDPTRAPQQTR